MHRARLPYADDTHDGDDAPLVVVAVVQPPAEALAKTALDTANAAYRQALSWMAEARPSNRDARAKYLDKCTRAALEAAAALRRTRRGA